MSEYRAGRRLRRSIFGYNRRDVDAYLDEERRREAKAPGDGELDRPSAEDLGRHIAGLLARFAESVTLGEVEAADKAAKVVADAEADATQIRTQASQLLGNAQSVVAETFKDAEQRHEAILAARDEAGAEIQRAIDRLNEALGALKSVPPLPDLQVPTVVLPKDEPVDLGRTTSSAGPTSWVRPA